MKNILYTIILCLLSTNLLAEERYSCTTETFSSPMVGEKDPQSKESIENNSKNSARKFLITITENQIFTTTLDGNNHFQNVYTVVHRNLLNTVAVDNSHADIGVHVSLIIETNRYDKDLFPNKPKKEIAASIFNYHVMFNNVWFLNCSSSL